MKYWWVVLLAACGGGGSAATVDAAPDAKAKPRTLLLAFDDILISPGTDDATMNTSSLVTDGVVLPRYLDTATDRATRIATIVSTAQAILAPYNIEVTTTRPHVGNYMLLVYTGSSSLIGQPDGITSIFPHCLTGGPNEVNVGFSFEQNTNDTNPDFTPAYRGSLAAVMVGTTFGIPFTTVDGDCMCFVDAGCTSDWMNTCTIGGAGTAVDATDSCSGAPATIDENGLFLAALGPH
jgi:hypothetical protein